MNLKDPQTWTHIYNIIREDFGFINELDSFSASLLSLMLQDYGSEAHKSVERLRELIQGRKALVVGAGPGCVNLRKYVHKYDVVIAADGALRCCINEDVIPEIVVSDLDGLSIKELIGFDGVIVVHAHGDNVVNILTFIPSLKKANKLVVGTHQSSTNYSLLNVFGGFTDGDRSAYLANYFDARKIGLVGFNFSGVVGKYSKPYLTDDVSAWPTKRRKLYWARRLISLLRTGGEVDVRCYDCED